MVFYYCSDTEHKRKEVKQMERTLTSIRLLTARDLAQILGSRPMAYRLLNREDFPYIIIGKRKLVREDRFMDWLEKQEKEI